MNYSRSSAFWATIAISFVLIISFSMLTISVAAQDPAPSPGGGDERKPVPKPQPEPPREDPPECPDMKNTVCTKTGEDGHPNDLVQAQGLALLACDSQYQGCVLEQDIEYYENKIECESVEGCKFEQNGFFETGCNIANVTCTGNHIDPTLGPFYCKAKATYDIFGYKCRMVEEDDPPDDDEEGDGETGGSGSP